MSTQVHPGGRVTVINAGHALVTYPNGGSSSIPMKKMPKGVKVGDIVSVTLEVTVKKVELRQNTD